jgi:hypothetical protein
MIQNRNWLTEEKQKWQYDVEFSTVDIGCSIISTHHNVVTNGYGTHATGAVGKVQSGSSTREINALADAILRGIVSRQAIMQAKQDARIKRMINRQLRLRKNVEFSLSD